jgi:hypothetical protein
MNIGATHAYQVAKRDSRKIRNMSFLPNGGISTSPFFTVYVHQNQAVRTIKDGLTPYEHPIDETNLDMEEVV